MINYVTAKQGKNYRIIATPPDSIPDFPAVGLYGVCKWTSAKHGACLEIGGTNYVIPFEAIEEMTLPNLDDALLVTSILNNPQGTLKILRGLWRMAKHPVVRNLMERGELPPDDPPKREVLPSNGKSSADYDKQWKEAEEAAASGAMVSEL